MLIPEFIQILNERSLDLIVYNVYTSSGVESEINLDEQRNNNVNTEVKNFLISILETINLELVKRFGDSETHNLELELADILQVINLVQEQFETMLAAAELNCHQEEQKEAIIKVRMINTDIFHKIPKLAGEVFYLL